VSSECPPSDFIVTIDFISVHEYTVFYSDFLVDFVPVLLLVFVFW
jgi:hypothetical protein